MSFIVSARKYRPIRFDEVVGQEHITTTLKNAILSNRVAHAYLFTGPRGVGKTTTARILAKALNCLNPQDAEPCGACTVCLAIQSNQLMDIIEIDAASNRGIDEIRALRESVKYAPTSGQYKVYIVDEVHMLTKDSFNAFLKTLEEPPPQTVFIFATTDAHRVPLTIISRCQRYDFRRIPLEVTKKQLQFVADSEGVSIDDKTLTLLARRSDGGLRDAESFFDQATAFCGNAIDYETVVRAFNFIDDEIYFTVSDAISSKLFSAAFDVPDTIYRNGWSFNDFLDGLLEHFRNILSVIISGSPDRIETAEVYKNRYAGYKSVFTTGDLLRMLNFLSKTIQEIRFSQNHKLKVEVALSHLIGIERSATISELLSALDAEAPALVYAVAPAEKKKTELIFSTSSDITQTNSVRTEAGQQSERGTEDTEAIGFTGELTEENISAFWGGYVTILMQTKPLMGDFIKQLRFTSFEKNTIFCAVPSALFRDALLLHIRSFTESAVRFFGKPVTLELQASESSVSENESSYQPKGGESILTRERIDDGDPIIRAIKDDLQGTEVLR